MRIGRVCIVFVSAILAMQSAHASEQSHGSGEQSSAQARIETEFFKNRDALRRQAADSPSGAVDVPIKLQEQIEEVIGPVKVAGFPVRGRMLPHLISDDPCCDSIYFLEFKNDEDEQLYVTTKGLVDNYMTGSEKYAAPVKNGKQTVEPYFSVLVTESDITSYTDLPVHSANEKYFARAFLGQTSAEDNAPGRLPDTIVVFILAGDRIYFMSSPSREELPEIPECKSRWSESHKKASVALAGYHASNKKNEKLWDEHVRLDKEGLAAYMACYGEKLRNQPVFASLVKQAQSMVDRIPLE